MSGRPVSRPRLRAAMFAAVLLGATALLVTTSPTGATEGDGTACVWGSVWHDDATDGVRSGGEPGASGVIVELTDAAMAVVVSAITGPAGDYRFTKLPAGTYRVRVTPPTGATLTATDVGGDDTVDSDVDGGTGETADLVLDAGTVMSSVDAGLIGGAGDPPAGIGDMVWDDDDLDGLQGPCEPGVADVTVELFEDTNVAATATTTTDDRGHYFFADPGTGTYRVRFVPPRGEPFTTMGAGGDDTANSDAAVADGTTAPFTYTTATSVFDVDAGLIVPDPPPSTVTSSSTVAPSSTVVACDDPDGCPPSTTAPDPDTPAAPDPTDPPVPTAPTTQPGPVFTGCQPDEIDVDGECLPIPASTPPPASIPATGDDDLAEAFNRYVSTLGPGTLRFTDECTGATDDNDEVDLRCAGLVVSEDFRLTITVSRLAADDPTPPADPPADPADPGAELSIRADTRMQISLTTDPTKLRVTPIDGEQPSDRVSRVSLLVAPGESDTAVFVVNPVRDGVHDARIDIEAVGGRENLRFTVSEGSVTFTVEPAPLPAAAAPTEDVVDLTTGPEGAGPAAPGDDGGVGALPVVVAGAVAVAAAAGGGFWWFTQRAARAAPAAVALAGAAAPAAAAAARKRRPTVFVSHTTADLERVKRVEAAIEAAGIATWFAPDKGTIPGGHYWEEEIVKGLEACDVFVIFLSTEAVQSPNVADELSLAKSEGKPILPVHLHPGVEVSDRMTLGVVGRQWKECFDDRPETHAIVVEAIEALLDRE